MAVLSKSKILAYLQCPKRLWLEVHQLESRTDSSATTASFATGNAVGDVSRQIYDPDSTGIFLDIKTLGLNGLIAATQTALAERKPIFEAGFRANGTLSLADILLPVEDDAKHAWRMVEVKSSAAVKVYHVKDLAIQTAIATQAGVRLTKVSVAHVDNTWTYPGNQQYSGLLKEVDQTAHVKDLGAGVAQWLNDAHLIADLPTPPAKSTGDHCTVPYECGFLAYCSASEPKIEHPVAWLPRVQTKLLKAHIASPGVKAMEDVPDSLLNDLQLRVKKHTLANTVYFDAAGAKAALERHPLPAYFLDFETINFAVPIWAGTRPYEQVPFQFSMHYLYAADQEPKHNEFLDLTGNNPTLLFAEALVQSCGQAGAIFVYNKGFESARLEDVIRHLQDEVQLVSALAAIKARLVDLKPITQDAYYNPSQKGSWSIKAVLTAMVPELSYKNLDIVQDGGGAQEAYLKAIGLASVDSGIADIELIRKQLLAYCELDTLAMVKIWQKLTQTTNTSALVLMDDQS
jgi:CRISPR/Cas system-associated exonuclease Cas4 (RecB family)